MYHRIRMNSLKSSWSLTVSERSWLLRFAMLSALDEAWFSTFPTGEYLCADGIVDRAARCRIAFLRKCKVNGDVSEWAARELALYVDWK